MSQRPLHARIPRRDPEEYLWVDRAICVGLDPDLFFPEQGDTAGVAKAKAICAVCPVADECREDALAWGDKHGVWGGTSELDRRRIRSERFHARKARERGAQGA